MVRSLLLTSLLLLPARVVAQEPLSHIPFCIADSSATALRDRVRFRVAGTDSLSRREEARVGLLPLTGPEVTVVVDDAICVEASRAYSAAAPAGTPMMPPPFPVVLVQAGDRYVVELPSMGGPHADAARVVVLDRRFRPLGSYRADE
jgi:hypothetical protein